MRGLKTAGINEVQAIKKRTMRLCAMGRISEEDSDKVIASANALEKTIESVVEAQEGSELHD